MADDSASRQRYPLGRNYPPADAQPRAPETDPLTELARLIGQTNPFGDARAPRANGQDRGWPGSAPAQPARAAQPPLSADYHAHERYEAQHYDQQRHDQQHYDQQHYDQQQYGQQQCDQQQYDQQQYDQHNPPPSASEYADYPPEPYDPQTEYGQPHGSAPYYGDNGQLSPDDPYAQPQYDDEEPAPRRRSGLITVAAVLGLAVLGVAGAYGYRSFFTSTAPTVPPLIKADGAPNKIVPQQQAGEGGASKQIYDRIGSNGQAEKIVPREEQPVDVKPANARPTYVPTPNGGGSPAISVATAAGQLPAAWPNPPGATVAAPASNPQSEPRKVRTVTIRPDQGTGSAQPAPAAPQPAPRAAATDLAPPPARSQAQPANPPRASSNGPLSLSPQATTRTASVEPRAAAPARTSAAAVGGGYVVQLSAQKSEEEATAAFHAAQARYPNLLGGRHLIVKRKDIAGKGTFYGAQVGPFASREDAGQLCEQLKAAGGTCLVQKN